MKHNIVSQQTGFTLVETLVAITVLLLVVIGPLTIAQKGIQSAYYATEQTTAVFLAQEAIEGLREMRDASALEEFSDTSTGGDTWSWYNDTRLIEASCRDQNPDAGAAGCAFENRESHGHDDDHGRDDDLKIESCGSSQCKLTIDEDTGEYSIDAGGDPTPFTRRVYLESHGSGVVEATVIVSWNSQVFGGALKQVRLQTWLYNHYERYES
jgi:type II secretory pathway pseudopilin PulG